MECNAKTNNYRREQIQQKQSGFEMYGFLHMYEMNWEDLPKKPIVCDTCCRSKKGIRVQNISKKEREDDRD